nr:hypothetical protein [Tanacetum cinerariifolium]
MLDASSAVTYTSVYTDFEPWRYYGEESVEAGSPRVIVYEYDGLLMQPIAPPSPDYVPRHEHPPSPDYVPGPEHPPSPVEIPYDEDPFEDEEDDEEEEEHLAFADSSAVPIVNPVLPARDTEELEADEPTPTPILPHTVIPLSQTRLIFPRLMCPSEKDLHYYSRSRIQGQESSTAEALYAREAWAGSEDRSTAIAAYVRTLEVQVTALIAQTSSLQTQLTTTLGRIEIVMRTGVAMLITTMIQEQTGEGK